MKLEASGLRKVLNDGKVLLDGISFSASKGEFVGILGPSGAGKTLTLRCLNGLMKPSEGDVHLVFDNGAKASITQAKERELRKLQQNIGVVFQGSHLVGSLTAIENVMLGRLGQINPWRSVLMGFTDEEAEEAMNALEQVKIPELALRRVQTLSGGEMQRVAIARVIFQRPPIILADEPISNLDPINARNIMRLLRPLAEHSVVVGVFHQPDLTMEFCDRILGLQAGKVIYDGSSKLSHAQLTEIYGEELKEFAISQ